MALTVTVCVPIAVGPNPSIPVPSDWKSSVTLPETVPALAVENPAAMALLAPCAAIAPVEPLALTLPVTGPAVASRFSE